MCTCSTGGVHILYTQVMHMYMLYIQHSLCMMYRLCACSTDSVHLQQCILLLVLHCWDSLITWINWRFLPLHCWTSPITPLDQSHYTCNFLSLYFWTGPITPLDQPNHSFGPVPLQHWTIYRNKNFSHYTFGQVLWYLWTTFKSQTFSHYTLGPAPLHIETSPMSHSRGRHGPEVELSLTDLVFKYWFILLTTGHFSLVVVDNWL